MTRREMLNRMDAKELSEWMAYDQIQPIGPQRTDLGLGIIAATIANCHRDPKKRSSAYEPSDFAPFLKDGEEKKKQSKAELLFGVQQLHAMVKKMQADERAAKARRSPNGNSSEPSSKRAGQNKVL